jgi:hypothetical protein
LVQPFVLRSELLNLASEGIDPGQPLTQQQFEAVDGALPVLQFAA